MSDMRNPLRRQQASQNDNRHQRNENRYRQDDYYDEYDGFDEYEEYEEVTPQPARHPSRQPQGGGQSQQRTRQQQTQKPISDYEMALKYFSGANTVVKGKNISSPKKNKRLLIIGAGAGLLLLGIATKLTFLTILGIIVIIVCVILSGPETKKVTDQEYDRIVNSMLARLDLENRAMRKLGLDRDEIREVRPIYFDAYRFVPSEEFLSKYGADGKWRSNKYEVSILFFCRSELYAYNYVLTTTRNMFRETTDMFFYDDIVSFSTVDERFTIKKPVIETNNKQKQNPSITPENGQESGNSGQITTTSIELTLRGGDRYTATVSNIESAQRSFDAMRTYLRELKRDSRR